MPEVQKQRSRSNGGRQLQCRRERRGRTRGRERRRTRIMRMYEEIPRARVGEGRRQQKGTREGS
eukprot:6143020-Heterocapsa_arctica.AAC.1